MFSDLCSESQLSRRLITKRFKDVFSQSCCFRPLTLKASLSTLSHVHRKQHFLDLLVFMHKPNVPCCLSVCANIRRWRHFHPALILVSLIEGKLIERRSLLSPASSSSSFLRISREFSWSAERRGVQTLQSAICMEMREREYIIIVLDEYATNVWMNSGLLVCLAIEYSDRVPGSEYVAQIGSWPWVPMSGERNGARHGYHCLCRRLQTTTTLPSIHLLAALFSSNARQYVYMWVDAPNLTQIAFSFRDFLWFTLFQKNYTIFFSSAVQEVNDRRFVHQILGKTEQFPLTIFLNELHFGSWGLRQHSRICRSIFKIQIFSTVLDNIS